MEILLVEDSLTDASLTIGALKRGDIQHRLTLVRDGEEAIQFLHKEAHFVRAPRPDLILLDLLLPKRSGIEVLRDVKDDFDLKNIPVVVLTASDSEETKLDCEELNVDAFIVKPVNMEKFLSVVRQLRKHLLADVILPASVG